jgi:hypothetical protein
MNRHILYNTAFRILFPLISGMILYLAMLTLFDSLGQLGDIFLSQEALFMVVLTYLNNELALYLTKRKIKNLVLYFTFLIALAVLVNSALTAAYFVFILGYSYFSTELVTINILFILYHAMVNLYYLSILHISNVRDISIQKEEDLGMKLELEMESFKKEMNPELIMTCLETLINLIHVNIEESEKYIQTLSNHYRYILDRRHFEITDLDHETEAAGELAYLLGYNVRESIIFESSIKKGSRLQIIPGTLLFMVNWVFEHMIASPLRPVHIRISIDGDQNVILTHEIQPKIQGFPGQMMTLENLNRSYRHYTGSEITSREGKKEMQWCIPRIPGLMEN